MSSQGRPSPRSRTESKPKPKLRLLLGLSGLIVLLLAGVLTLMAEEFVREQLIRPLLVLFVVIRLYLGAMPQLLLWFFVLLLLVFFGVFTLRDLGRGMSGSEGEGRELHQRRQGALSRAEPPEEGPKLGTIEDLAERITLSAEGEYFKWRIRRELQDFLVRLIAWREGLEPEEALELVRSGRWTGEPRVREFFQRSFARRYGLLRWWLEALRPPWLKRVREREFEQELALIVDYLESYAQGGRPSHEHEGAGALAKRGE